MLFSCSMCFFHPHLSIILIPKKNVLLKRLCLFYSRCLYLSHTINPVCMGLHNLPSPLSLIKPQKTAMMITEMKTASVTPCFSHENRMSHSLQVEKVQEGKFWHMRGSLTPDGCVLSGGGRIPSWLKQRFCPRCYGDGSQVFNVKHRTKQSFDDYISARILTYTVTFFWSFCTDLHFPRKAWM